MNACSYNHLIFPNLTSKMLYSLDRFDAVALFIFATLHSVDAGQLYVSRLLRNPGLAPAIVTCLDACINLCSAQSSCSAVSYQRSSGTCYLSKCNNLDMYRTATPDWITYIMGSLYIESVGLQPLFEWMLTDTCGNSSQGILNGPSMQLFKIQYASSPSLSAGNTVKFLGAQDSNGRTSTNAVLNNPLGTSSITVMLWAMWEVSSSSTTLAEFSRGTSQRGVSLWLYGGGLFYAMFGTSSSNNFQLNLASFVPTVNTWYHIAFSYDGQQSIMKAYLNYTLMGVSKVSASNSIIWDTLEIATSVYDGTGIINGRLFCYKIFNSTLIASDIAAMGESCKTGKIRFS